MGGRHWGAVLVFALAFISLVRMGIEDNCAGEDAAPLRYHPLVPGAEWRYETVFTPGAEADQDREEGRCTLRDWTEHRSLRQVMPQICDLGAHANIDYYSLEARGLVVVGTQAANADAPTWFAPEKRDIELPRDPAPGYRWTSWSHDGDVAGPGGGPAQIRCQIAGHEESREVSGRIYADVIHTFCVTSGPARHSDPGDAPVQITVQDHTWYAADVGAIEMQLELIIDETGEVWQRLDAKLLSYTLSD